MFYPKDAVTRAWNWVVSATLLYVTFVMTFELSFVEEPAQFFIVSEYLTTACFGLDIVFNFNKAYVDRHDKLVTDRGRIALRYLRGWFAVDLVSFFPFFVFSRPGSPIGLTMGLKTFKFLKLLNVVRLIRLVKVIRQVWTAQGRDPARLLKQNIRKNYERLAVHCLYILIWCHVFACLFHLIPTVVSPSRNWVVRRKLQGLSGVDKYLFAVHWVVETIITVGYGEVPIG